MTLLLILRMRLLILHRKLLILRMMLLMLLLMLRHLHSRMLGCAASRKTWRHPSIV